MSIPFTFFGSSRFSVLVLDELEKAGLVPASIVTTPDKPQGRSMTSTPTPVKEWARARTIPVHDPEKLDDVFATKLKEENVDVFIVASYGKIIPGNILDIPTHKSLNIHPSLLPLYRGASPLQSAMLDDAKKTGVTIIRMDEKMDHGPVVAHNEINISEWPTYEEFEELAAREGSRLLVRILPDWISGKITEQEQDHAVATFTKKISKSDGLIDLSGDPYLNFRKIQAYHAWPQAYFIQDHNGRSIRVKITRASYAEGKLIIEKVIPEGSREMNYEDFLRGYKNNQ